MSNCKYVCNRFVFVVIYSLTKFVTYLLTQIGNIKHISNKITTISVKKFKNAHQKNHNCFTKGFHHPEHVCVQL